MFILNKLREWNASRKRREHGWSNATPHQSFTGYQQNRMLLQDHLFRSNRIGSRKERRRHV